MTTRPLSVVAICCGLGLTLLAIDVLGQIQTGGTRRTSASQIAKPKSSLPTNPLPGKLPAPGLEGGTGWLNTSDEITLAELRGKIVLLDFWTYCCINCMHILPDLAYLEKKFPNELVVIGVHSAKFYNERDTENVRRAILRYEIKHPVVNDSALTLWNKYGIDTWPTLILIDPEGKVCLALRGEGNRKNLDLAISRLITYHKAKGTLDPTPFHFNLESGKKAPRTPLRFPGKVLADQATNRLFISDSNHNRIVIADLDGKVLDIVGAGVIGRKDGSFAEAQFDHPQGLDLQGDLLYVADTENHSIRTIDLAAKQVKTIAGTGKQAALRSTGGVPASTALSSPWDLKKVGNKLFIAMAGPHQIWVMENNSIRPYAGSGKEDVLNGTLKAAAFAQPSGITTDGKFLYVVDSEGSAIRKVPLESSGRVSTIVGTSDLPDGRCLFMYDDIDGIGNQARLQHPIGITSHNGMLYVADSYNHKIKVIDLEKKSLKTFLGTGKPGVKDDIAEFSEPAGLSIAGEKLYVADTNNHAIRVIDLKSGKVAALDLKDLAPPQPPAIDSDVPGIKVKELPPQIVESDDHLEFRVTLAIPEGFKLNPAQDPIYRIVAAGEQTLVAPENLNQGEELPPAENALSIKVPLASRQGSGKFKLNLSYTICSQNSKGGVCQLKTASWLIPITVKDAAEQKALELQVD